MKILDRYILKEISGYSLLALVVFTFVLATPEVLRLSELLARQSVSLATLLKLSATVLPGKLMWTIPMAVLVGLLVGWSRLAADGEIIALQATAIGFGRLLRPAALFAAASFLVALVTSLWWAPQAARQFQALQAELAAGQIPYAIQAHVFDERFQNLILYVQEVESGAARWQGVLLADRSHPSATKLTLAETGITINEPDRQRLRLHLLSGSIHEHLPGQSARYSVSTFAESDLSLSWPESQIKPIELRGNAKRTLGELWAARGTGEHWRSFRIDFHRRFALPAACLVFALLAVPLGMTGSHGGRAGGVVLAFLFLVSYYILFVITDRFAREGPLTPWLGVWASNLAFALLGAWLLLRTRRPAKGDSPWYPLVQFLSRWQRAPEAPNAEAASPSRTRVRPRSGFPRLLDFYVTRGILFHFLLLLGSFLVLFELFNLLDLIDDIAKNQAGWRLVVEYLFYLLPQALYWMVPLAALLAVLVELGLLSKNNELVAIKAAGISLFRIATPVLALGLLLSLGLFLLDFYYLPYTNQRQDALRNQIKGRPPQTFYQPQRKWIFGQAHRIFNYRFFDSSQNLFGELSVLELEPDGFGLRRRLYARRVHWAAGLQTWVFEDGWERDFEHNRPITFKPFTVATFPEVTERPEYFKKEVLDPEESAQMNFRELGRYIGELRQAGFEVSRLRVHWHRKFAFPLTAFVMVLLAYPFALTVGWRGALGGIAFGIGLGLAYWVVSALFEALGNFQMLPPLLAGWGPDLLFAFTGAYWLLHIRT
ncbi:MAG: LptF/LptG family permease [Terriglobia bacterium]